MAKKSLSAFNTPTPWAFAFPDSNGKAPESRVQTANDAWIIANQLKLDNAKREEKWGRIYRCYKLFPPTDYSLVAKKGMQGLSNVPFGAMKYAVDNQKSSFYDMVTERGLAATIITKEGNVKDKKEFSEKISIGFDRVLREWRSYLYNVEIDQEEMSLYGKGIEFADDKTGWTTRSLHNYEVLIPDRTYADLSNLGECVLKRRYTPLEWWDKVTGGNKETEASEKYAKDLGYNFWACVDALRLWTSTPSQHLTNSQYLQDVAAGNVNLSRYYNINIDVYEIYIKEFSGSISKMMVLQTYLPIHQKWSKSLNVKDDTEYRERAGFLFYKKDWEPKEKGWSELIMPFMDCTGSGLWHEIKGFAEGIFVACRQFDINMNRLMDAANINMMFMVKGGSADATRKLKQMEWLPISVLPEDVEPIQSRFQLPTQETMQLMQYYMGEMYRGIGAYRINAPTAKGGQRTKGEAELDAAESAKLSGTQIKRYNECHSNWQRALYNRMINTSRGGAGFDLKEKFEEFMEEQKVPKDAWKNIEYMESNMLSGAGSPSFKLMASEKTIALTGMTAANEGQEEAIRDGIAALQGRNNVDRYRPRKTKDLPVEARVIGFENATLDNPLANPENARVHPEDNHIEHFRGHYSDAMVLCDQIEGLIQQGMADGKLVMEAHAGLMLKGGHMMAHLDYLMKDPGKENEVKQFEAAIQQLQGRTDQIGSIGQEMMQAQQPEQKTEEQLKLEYEAAMSAIKVREAEQKSNIKIASIATQHDLRQNITKEKAATSLAVTRAKATQDIQLKEKQNGSADKKA